MATVAQQIERPAPPREPDQPPASLAWIGSFFSGMAILSSSASFCSGSRKPSFSAGRPLPPWKHAFAGPRPLIVHIHGAVLASWFVLLVVQTRLVASRHVRLHRRLGMLAWAWRPSWFWSVFWSLAASGPGLPGWRHQDRHGRRQSRGPLRRRGVRSAGWAGLPISEQSGSAQTADPDRHDRDFAAGDRALLGLHLETLLAGCSGHCDGLVLVIAIYDLISRRRVHPATIGGGLFYVLVMNAWVAHSLSGNRGWWFDLAVQAQNFGHHLT